MKVASACCTVSAPRARGEGAAVDYGSGGRAVAVDAVGAGAEDGNVLSRYLFGAGQSELLVASADAAVADGDGHFAAGDQADAGDFSFEDRADG